MDIKKENRTFLLIIDGPMGAGKTTVAKMLHPKLKRTSHIGLDRIKVFISDFKRNPSDNKISGNIVLAMTQEYLKQGINVLIEQGLRGEQIEVLKKIAKKHKADCFIYQLTAPRLLLQSRVLNRTQILGKPKISKARIERNYKIHLENRYIHAVVFDSEKLNPKQIANQILKEVKKSVK